MKHPISVKINGKQYTHDVEPRLLLIHYLREVVGLTGPHIGCETSLCGACTVIVDGKAVKSCSMFAVQADGAKSPPSKAWPPTASCTRPGSLLERARTAVRLLHARHDHGHQADARTQSEPHR